MLPFWSVSLSGTNAPVVKLKILYLWISSSYSSDNIYSKLTNRWGALPTRGNVEEKQVIPFSIRRDSVFLKLRQIRRYIADGRVKIQRDV